MVLPRTSIPRTSVPSIQEELGSDEEVSTLRLISCGGVCRAEQYDSVFPVLQMKKLGTKLQKVCWVWFFFQPL